MIVLQCKMCGASLDLDGDKTIGTCQYCGFSMVIPGQNNRKLVDMYNRADYYRRNYEFDKSMLLYEDILKEDKTEAEAYWSLVLCKYGVEYVKDPRTNRYVPTCNRTRYTGIYSDEDYQTALEYAKPEARDLYTREAEWIDKVQKSILRISNMENPYDVFICYKEADDDGNRTEDSVLAQQLYSMLVKEGFKVFFARISLEDKLGSAYEPYIFNAINTAQVMVVIGTKAEHLHSAWVKNEWMRFLEKVKADSDKVLIPAFKGIMVKEMPEEFQYLQSQDLSKIGAFHDLVWGIQKICNRIPNSRIPNVQEKPVHETIKKVHKPIVEEDVDSLLDLAYSYLEELRFDKAENVFNKVINREPNSIRAYMGKLLVELQVNSVEQLVNVTSPIEESDNFKKLCYCVDDSFKEKLNEFVLIRRENHYNKAIEAANKAKTTVECDHAIRLLMDISGYKDVERYINKCKKKIGVNTFNTTMFIILFITFVIFLFINIINL